MPSEKAFDCKENDGLFGGGTPKPQWRAGPVRKDFQNADRGALVIQVKEARETLEEYERLYISRNERAFESRLQLLGTQISALEEIERRMREALKPQKKGEGK